MTKARLIEREIEVLESRVDKLKRLKTGVSGMADKVCPDCKTKNYHWHPPGIWCCAFC